VAETPGRAERVRDDAASSPAWARLTDTLPTPPAPDDTDLLWHQLCAYLAWYERAARRARIGYRTTRLLAIVVGSAVTVLAASSAPAILTASLAAVVVVLEGTQQLFQFQVSWIRYRETAETLRRTGHQYAARVPPYDTGDRRARLAELLDVTVISEGRAWTQAMRRPATPLPATESTS
jgi:hypothetical protein